MENKEAQALDYLLWLLLAVVTFIVVFMINGILTGKGIGILGQISDLFRGRS